MVNAKEEIIRKLRSNDTAQTHAKRERLWLLWSLLRASIEAKHFEKLSKLECARIEKNLQALLSLFD